MHNRNLFSNRHHYNNVNLFLNLFLLEPYSSTVFRKKRLNHLIRILNRCYFNIVFINNQNANFYMLLGFQKESCADKDHMHISVKDRYYS